MCLSIHAILFNRGSTVSLLSLSFFHHSSANAVTMVLTVYGFAASTCTSRVLTTVFEKDVEDYQIQKVDLATGEHKKPEFLALQPFGVIPVLKDGDLTIFESRAIARYIATKYEGQGTPLYGTTLADKAKVEQWLEVEANNYNPPISAAVFQLVFAKYLGAPPDESVVKVNLEKLGTVLDIYDAHLAKNEYLAGDFFSLADLSHIPYTHYLINVANKGELFNSRSHVKAWWDKISARPSWKKCLELAAQH